MRQRTILIVVAIGLIIGVTLAVASAFFLGAMWRLVVSPDDEIGRTRNVEAMFIEQMVPHHQDAIDMADLALTRAKRPEIRALAERIKESQTAENEQMRGWYQEWFGTELPEAGSRNGMMGPMMGGGTDLERLSTAVDFDKEFIEQMVPHHRLAIMMSRMAGRATDRAELRRLTDSIIETQSREIRDMQRWYAEWYRQ